MSCIPTQVAMSATAIRRPPASDSATAHWRSTSSASHRTPRPSSPNIIAASAIMVFSALALIARPPRA